MIISDAVVSLNFLAPSLDEESAGCFEPSPWSVVAEWGIVSYPAFQLLPGTARNVNLIGPPSAPFAAFAVIQRVTLTINQQRLCNSVSCRG